MKNYTVNDMTFIALMAAILCVISPINILLPFSPVPLSLSLLVIYLCTIVIGLKNGIIAVLIYLLIGAAGIPVFSGFSGGIGKMLGPTGGYMIGYVFIALFTGIFVNKFKGNIYMYAVGMVVGTAICYTIGTVWLSYVAGMNLKAAFVAGVLLYIPGDTVKIIIACVVGEKVRRVVEKI